MDKYTKKLLIYTTVISSCVYVISVIIALFFLVQPISSLLFFTLGFAVGLTKIYILFCGIKRFLLDVNRPKPLFIGLIAFLFILSWVVLGVGCYFAAKISMTHFIMMLTGYGISLLALFAYCFFPVLHKDD